MYILHCLQKLTLVFFNDVFWKEKIGFGKVMKKSAGCGIFMRKGAGMPDQHPCPFQTVSIPFMPKF